MLDIILKATILVALMLNLLTHFTVQAEETFAPDIKFIVDEDALENPEETGPYMEGDIKDTVGSARSLERNAVLSESLKWHHGVVPYELKGTFSSQDIAIISHALNEYHTKTCIRFRKRVNNERDYIVITNTGSGCWSSVGRVGGRQDVNLESPKCFSNYGTTIHELMHVLGFYHEQNRYERDTYVRVMSENVKTGMMPNFLKLPFSSSTAFGVSYDYGSVMHYKATSFSKNGKPTLVAVTTSPDISKMGQRSGFSAGDIRKINSMYKCV